MLSTTLATLIALAPAAWAGPTADEADEAERDRIVEEMQGLASRQQWKGVELQYGRLLQLEKRGVSLGPELHMLAVEAARTFGDIDAVVYRLGQAIQAGDPQAGQQRADVLSRYGRVRLEIASRPSGEWGLEQVPTPFAPDARAAIARADEALHDKRRYVGFLPAGAYRVGAARFQVDAGTSEALVTLVGDAPTGTPAADRGDDGATAPGARTAQTGLRARAGLGFGGATAPSAGTLAPPSGAGLTPVLGAGLAWRRGPLQLSGMLMGRALLATAGDGGQQVVLGTAELLLGWDVGPLRVEAGPAYGVGAGRSIGVADSADPVACAAGACGAEVVRGTTLGAGGELGLTLPLFDTRGGIGGIDLHAGALGDGTRLLPWVTVAVGVAPGGRP